MSIGRLGHCPILGQSSRLPTTLQAPGRSASERANDKLAAQLSAFIGRAVEDLIGALRDKVGVPVRLGESDKVFNHEKEISDALKSMTKTIKATQQDITSTHAKLMLEGLKEFKMRVEKFLEIR